MKLKDFERLDKEFNAFEGKRYFDYDDMSMKNIIFHKKKFVKCKICRCRIYKIVDAFYVYNRLLCRKCCVKFSEEADKVLEKALNNFI